MKTRLILWIALGLLAGVLVACSLVGSKGDVIKCTGTFTFDNQINGGSFTYPEEEKSHVSGLVYQFNMDSNCPELKGVATVSFNGANFQGAGPVWGTFVIDSTYNGGGVFEGTWNGGIDMNDPNQTFLSKNISHYSYGSVKGLQLELNGAGEKFEATLQNAPSE